MIAWNGSCYVHHQITPEQIDNVRKHLPHVKVIVHPECRSDVLKLADAVLSTSGMIKYAKESDAQEFLVVTECGLSDRLLLELPEKKFYKSCKLCAYMKMITLDDTLRSLKEMRHPIELESQCAPAQALAAPHARTVRLTTAPARTPVHADATVGVAVDVVPLALHEGRVHAAVVRVENGDERGRLAFPAAACARTVARRGGRAKWLEGRLPRARITSSSCTPSASRVAIRRRAWCRSRISRCSRRRSCTPVLWVPCEPAPRLAYDHHHPAHGARACARSSPTRTSPWALLDESLHASASCSRSTRPSRHALDWRNFRKRILARSARAARRRRATARTALAQLYCFATRRPITVGVLAG